MRREDFVQNLLQCMIEADRAKAQTLVEQAFAAGFSKEQILNGILDKAMIEMGEGWYREEFSLAQTFVAAKIAEDTFQRCMPEKSNEDMPASKGRIVIGNIEDDFHSLGRRIVSSFLRVNNWEVIDLGNDVVAEEFLEAASENETGLVGVSAMMYSTAVNIKKVRDLIDQRGLKNKMRLAVGGAVFNWQPELLEKVGGDGSANSAFEVDGLFLRLKKELEEAAS